MFLKTLKIESNSSTIREIAFKKGLNLIIDETAVDDLQSTGNNVGKTTVLRLIDFCLGGKGENIYRDPEFKDKSNSLVAAFLTEQKIVITLVVIEQLSDLDLPETTIRRNFLKRKDKIQEINGEYYNDKDFDQKLKEIFFKTSVQKPTFRQIISKNIRDEKNKLQNTLKVLHYNTTKEEYEALYMFWLGIDTDSHNRKVKLSELKKTEEKLFNRLKKGFSASEIEQALKVIERDIAELDERKDNFNLNENYENDLEELNQTKARINKLSTEISRLKIRKELIDESRQELEREKTEIDTKQLEEIYNSANSFIPDLQVRFNDLVQFHNKMLDEKINFVTSEVPKIDNFISTLTADIQKAIIVEKSLAEKINKTGAVEELESIIDNLNEKYEQKGMYEEQLRQWHESRRRLDEIEEELSLINQGIKSLDSLISKRITSFNEYFSRLSSRLYDEQFILSHDKTERAYELKISSVGGNLGTGKKKGQIAAFDFAYIQFCEENDIPCLHFILHDQNETIHDNQLNLLADLASEINCQYIVPVLKDKLPSEIDIESNSILVLSQSEKLFKI